MENKSDQSIKVRSNIWWPLSLYFLLLLLLFDLLINVFIVIDACDDQEGRKSVTASTNHKDVGSDWTNPDVRLCFFPWFYFSGGWYWISWYSVTDSSLLIAMVGILLLIFHRRLIRKSYALDGITKSEIQTIRLQLQSREVSVKANSKCCKKEELPIKSKVAKYSSRANGFDIEMTQVAYRFVEKRKKNEEKYWEKATTVLIDWSIVMPIICLIESMGVHLGSFFYWYWIGLYSGALKL